MIQRIQTIFLLIVTALTTTLLFPDLLTYISPEGTMHLTAFGISTDGIDGLVVKTIFFGALIVLAAVASFLSIFLYRNRVLQARIVVSQIALQVGIMAFLVIYYLKFKDMTTEISGVMISYIDIFPVINMLLLYMAYRRILKDEFLIRSVNRIR